MSLSENAKEKLKFYKMSSSNQIETSLEYIVSIHINWILLIAKRERLLFLGCNSCFDDILDVITDFFSTYNYLNFSAQAYYI